MKPRHAAALVLVGWYLMLPPNAAVRDTSTSLAHWSVEGTFDTASDCQEAMASLSQRAESERRRKIGGPGVEKSTAGCEFAVRHAGETHQSRQRTTENHALCFQRRPAPQGEINAWPRRFSCLRADFRHSAPSAVAALELPCSQGTPMTKAGRCGNANYASGMRTGSGPTARTFTI
jgi:hypothetical protein